MGVVGGRSPILGCSVGGASAGESNSRPPEITFARADDRPHAANAGLSALAPPGLLFPADKGGEGYTDFSSITGSGALLGRKI